MRTGEQEAIYVPAWPYATYGDVGMCAIHHRQYNAWATATTVSLPLSQFGFCEVFFFLLTRLGRARYAARVQWSTACAGLLSVHLRTKFQRKHCPVDHENPATSVYRSPQGSE